MAITEKEGREFNNGFNSGYESGYEAGRESVIANRETFQKVKAEGIRQGIKEGMARAKEIIRNVVYTDSQVLYRQRQNLLEELQSVDFLSVYKEIDNE